jgi:hypothetical protein
MNEPELITTLHLEFTDSANSANQIIVKFKDPDGEGGNAPVQFDSLLLPANKTWFCKTVLLNESVSPAENISESILQEADEHLFIYTVSGLNLSVTISDFDSNNIPLGLKSIWRTGSLSSGNVRVVLKHQPGIKDGNPALGETDAELVFKGRIF